MKKSNPPDSLLCKKCGQTKPTSEFYRCSTKARGFSFYCKKCQGLWRHENPAKARAIDERRKKSPGFYAKRRETARKRYLNRPERYKAKDMVKAAVLAGDLSRGPCEICGTMERVEGHHEDYSKPLEVRWLCFQHHREAHGQRIRPPAEDAPRTRNTE